MPNSGPEPLPRLHGTREQAGRRIQEAIDDFAKLRTRIPDDPIPDLRDAIDIQRRHTIELLRSLFDDPRPADEFDEQTTQRVFYPTSSDTERRHNLDEEIRQCITELRSLTARLEFYHPQREARPERTATRAATPAIDKEPGTPPPAVHAQPTPEPAPPLVAIGLFLVFLIIMAGLILWQQDNIGNLDKHPTAKAPFFLIISLVPAILLFGLFKSVAKATGKLYGLTVKLGGPAALFIIVLLGLTNLPTSNNPPQPTTTAPTTPATTTATTTEEPPTTTTAPVTDTMTQQPNNSSTPQSGWAWVGTLRSGTWTNHNFTNGTGKDGKPQIGDTIRTSGKVHARDKYKQPFRRKPADRGILPPGTSVHVDEEHDVGSDIWIKFTANNAPTVQLPNSQDTLTADFSGLVLDASQTKAAFPFLHDLGITITDIQPSNTEVIIKNNRAWYGGRAIHPTTSENFLTQQGNTGPAFFTLALPRPFHTITITRPELIVATRSGVSHPAWQAIAYNAAGKQVATVGEALIDSKKDAPQRTLTLTAREPITTLRIASDPRVKGENKAAFNGVLIERMTFAK